MGHDDDPVAHWFCNEWKALGIGDGQAEGAGNWLDSRTWSRIGMHPRFDTQSLCINRKTENAVLIYKEKKIGNS
jgi:hypothetical protein